jgi:hypothetical protein
VQQLGTTADITAGGRSGKAQDCARPQSPKLFWSPDVLLFIAGNDLSRSFRWGAEFVPNWIKGHASVYSTLKRVSQAVWALMVLAAGVV